MRHSTSWRIFVVALTTRIGTASTTRPSPVGSSYLHAMHRQVTERPSDHPRINYGGRHPWERRGNDRDREMREGGGVVRRPLRIEFDVTDLKSRHDNDDDWDDGNAEDDDDDDALRIRILREDVLPAVSRTYSQMVRVIPVVGPIPVSKDECFGYLPTPPTTSSSNDSDLRVFVAALRSVGGSAICGMGYGVLAAASPCGLDQHDRPVTGFINFCLDEIPVVNGRVSEETLSGLRSVAIHEFAHVLGINGESWKFFRHPGTGLPLTKRPFVSEPVQCVSGVVRETVRPSCRILTPMPQAVVTKGSSSGPPLRQGSGSTSSSSSSRSRNGGALGFQIVTPTVRRVVQNQFGCPKATGAYLENQPTNPHDCYGTHWDERYFYTETLSAYYAPEADYLSALTLALLEDSGWYEADYASSSTTSEEGRGPRNSPFGHGAGCEFLEGPCIDPDGSLPDYARGFFCNDPLRIDDDATGGKGTDGESSSQSQGQQVDFDYTCDPSHTHKAGCDLLHGGRPDLPPEARYFANEPYLTVYLFDHADYCPIAQVGAISCRRRVGESHRHLSDDDDNDDDDSDTFTDEEKSFYGFLPGETYGPNSLCYDVTREVSITTTASALHVVADHDWSSSSTTQKTAMCLESKCNAATRSLEIMLDADFVPDRLVCRYGHDFTTHDYRDDRGHVWTITCPRLAAACPHLFCPSNCSGRGVCDYDDLTTGPRCICDDPTDHSDRCAHTPQPLPLDTDDECLAAITTKNHNHNHNNIPKETTTKQKSSSSSPLSCIHPPHTLWLPAVALTLTFMAWT